METYESNGPLRWYTPSREERDSLILATAPPQCWWYVGVDLGQAQDPTAIAVLERHDVTLGCDPATRAMVRRREFWLRHIERLPLGTPYPEVAGHIAHMVRRIGDQAHTVLVLDATGVGAPVVDLVQGWGLTCRKVAVTITGGNEVKASDGRASVPKKDLITGMQVLFETNRLKMSEALPGAKALIQEFLSIRVRVTDHGHEQFGAWRDGEHDDLVLAVALACWQAQWGQPSWW